jgi:hypothetical protein
MQYDIAALISLQNNLQPGTARDIEMHFPQNRCNVFRLTSSNDKINSLVSNPTLDGPGYKQSSACLTYVVLQVLTRLGYTLSLNKCQLSDTGKLNPSNRKGG